jgi:hypothetical protein
MEETIAMASANTLKVIVSHLETGSPETRRAVASICVDALKTLGYDVKLHKLPGEPKALVCGRCNWEGTTEDAGLDWISDEPEYRCPECGAGDQVRCK